MELGALAFYAVAAATIIAALGVVTSRSVVYSALLLILALSLTGLVYLLLLSDFLALVQILIYGGTVSILLVFALMLTRPQERPVQVHRGWPVAALAAVLFFAVLVYQAVGTDWATAARTVAQTSATPIAAGTRSTTSATSTARSSANSASTARSLATHPAEGQVRISPGDLGMALFTTWAVPFEIASLVLLVALMGALLIARASDEPPVAAMVVEEGA